MRPSKAAAFALLARAYLFVGQYEGAGKYADSCLQINKALLNFNTLSSAASFPVPQFNAEVVFNSSMGNPVPINPGRAKIDSVLYTSYATNDLRRSIFFRPVGSNTWVFKGSFSGSAILFTGITTAEMFLTRAECTARSGNLAGAANDLNTLLMHRWKTGTFLPLSFATPAAAVEKILMERRKELVYRTLRWMDIKRLNKEGYGIILKRLLNGQVYTLLPEDLRYSLPLPEDVILLSGMQQNPR
jgi:hypothetical protein